MKIGILAGNFDVIHPGYMKMFKESKNVCDLLVIALHSDPSIERPEKLKPILTLEERKEVLEGIRYVDNIVTYTYESELVSILQSYPFDVRLLGDDYKERTDYTGYGLCKEVHFFDRSHGWSTTKYKNLIAKTC